VNKSEQGIVTEDLAAKRQLIKQVMLGWLSSTCNFQKIQYSKAVYKMAAFFYELSKKYRENSNNSK
jgi:hypothetical protein